jgi:hypothetical protein
MCFRVPKIGFFYRVVDRISGGEGSWLGGQCWRALPRWSREPPRQLLTNGVAKSRFRLFSDAVDASDQFDVSGLPDLIPADTGPDSALRQRASLPIHASLI